MKKEEPFLSIIIPVYNERNRLHNLQKIISYLKTKALISEIIVIDDGSNDDTPRILQTFKKRFSIQTISLAKNKGKGFAIKTGMLAAKGRYRLFTDVDLSTPIETFDDFIPYLKQFPILIASRRVPGARIALPQPKVREAMGQVFTTLSKIILWLDINDFTCGFKCFSQGAAEAVFRRATIDRWGFDSETLFIANLLNFPVKEIGVTWRNDGATKVRFPQDIIQSLIDLIRIRLHGIRGLYRKPTHRIP